MRNIITFLTSKEIIVVYIVAGIACFLAFIIYLIDKNYDKRKQRHNTKELNKLVEEVADVLKEEQASNYSEPILEPIAKDEVVASNVVQEPLKEKVEVLEDVIPAEENIVLENLNNIDVKEEKVKQEEPLQYTTIEPNPEQAKEELRKLAMELEEEEKRNKEDSPTVISNYEEEQETNAIISLEELVKKSKEMYSANELSQYKDEGNEPISLADLERTKQTNSAPLYDEPFIIANVVSDMEKEIDKVSTPLQLQISDFNEPLVTAEEPVVNTVSIDTNDKNEANEKAKDLYQSGTFKKSPVISPIYGIEKEQDYLELENTANYDKLDEEIRKTNEFLMTLKELQRHLD